MLFCLGFCLNCIHKGNVHDLQLNIPVLIGSDLDNRNNEHMSNHTT